MTNIPGNKYTSTIYDFNEFELTQDGKNKSKGKDIDSKKEKHYYAMDYFSKGLLFDYIDSNKLTEKLQKVIFKRIIEGFKFLQSHGICHLDIKPENIILDKEFQPIIIDFGFSQKFIKNNKKVLVHIYKGSEPYISPEIWAGGEIKGEKADIFSLGVVLFNLATGMKKSGFKNSKNSEKETLYHLIREKKYEEYWKSLIGFNFSDEFKELYMQMVFPKPNERPELDDILECKWLREVRNLSEEEEKEINRQLDAIHDEIMKEKNNEYELYINKRIKNGKYNSRGGISNGIKFFSENSELKNFTKNKFVLNKYIIIDGLLKKKDLANFMDNLAHDIVTKFKDNCRVEPLPESLRFKVNFIYNENQEDGNCDMDIELFKYEENNYLLEFKRIKGNIPDYYEHFKKIKELIPIKTKIEKMNNLLQG